MRITHRVVSPKRHTKGYMVNGKRMTRSQVVKMAKRGHFAGITARRGDTSWYITSNPSREASLYDLPMIVESRRGTRAAAK